MLSIPLTILLIVICLSLVYSSKKRDGFGNVHANHVLTLIASLFLGVFGIDRLLMGHASLGILKLLTGGGFLIWWLIDLIRIAEKKNFEEVIWK